MNRKASCFLLSVSFNMIFRMATSVLRKHIYFHGLYLQEIVQHLLEKNKLSITTWAYLDIVLNEEIDCTILNIYYSINMILVIEVIDVQFMTVFYLIWTRKHTLVLKKKETRWKRTGLIGCWKMIFFFFVFYLFICN